MAKTEANIETCEQFIKRVLSENFGQEVDSEQLRQAAEKLCEALPDKETPA